MARRKVETETPLLDEIESLGDRLSHWVAANPVPVLGSGALVLILAAGIGGYQSYRTTAEDRAATALADVELAYRTGMGGSADSLEVPEPANPETGRSMREKTIAEYVSLAEEHAGTSVAALARLQAGSLAEELGQGEEALSLWEQAVTATAADEPLRAVVLVRLGRALEETGNWEEAAARYREAGDIVGYPLRFHALADAARCLLRAGDAASAASLAQRIEQEAPDLELPPHVQSKLREITSGS